MLVAFFDPENTELSAQKKGDLFEELTRRLATEAGFTNVVLKRKHASLEYDVEGESILHRVPLTGEAKAHEATIRGQDVAAFVGKLLPLAANGRVLGLFISVSDFTPDAKDYLDTTLPTLAQFQIELTTLVGPAIPKFFVNHAGYASDETIRSRVKELHGLHTLDTWLVASQTGDFLVASCGPNEITAATNFALFKTDGTELTLEADDVDRLSRQLPDLAELVLVTTSADLTTEAARAEGLPTVAAGAGSLDYRFPAPPEYFIGRTEPLAAIKQLLEQAKTGTTAVRAAQVLSRSGVGKSSLLLKTPTVVDAPVVTLDGRSIRAASDARLVVTEAVLKAQESVSGLAELEGPSSLEQAAGGLQALGEALSDQNAVLVAQVDQFESTLRVPAAFDAIRNFVEATTTHALPIIWIFARKSDVAVTFDEGAEIDLGRLNALSEAIRLDDFNADESRLMFDQLEAVIGESIRPELATAISTFSGGFPWLHKRLCAHVETMHREGIGQRELVQTGLRAEDLFEEDLAGLTEQDRALLRRIATHLPATAGELATHLEAEINPGRLTEKLNDFLSSKLLRLSGDIYDAYNDVFKTYLVTDQIPFEARYVYRVQPRAAIQMVRTIARLGPRSLTDFQNAVGGSHVANLNKLRELRLLGLINPKPGRVELALETQEALEKNALGELLRRRLRANGLVVRALDLVAANDEVSLEQLVAELQRELPQVEIAAETWTLYAKTLANWLHFASLAQFGGGVLSAREVPADEALEGRVFTRGVFAPDTFVPSARPPQVVELLGMFDGRDVLPMAEAKHAFGWRNAPGIAHDAQALDLVEESDEGLMLAGQGRMLIDSGRPITSRDVAQLALTKANVRALLDGATPGPLSADAQRQTIEKFGSTQWADGTWKWRLGVMRSWLVATGLVESKRAGLVRAE
jgi:hypothetical protein